MSRLSWGEYDFPDYSVQFGIRKRAILGPFNRRLHYECQMSVRALYLGEDPADITEKLEALHDALNTNDQDLTFLDNAGDDTVHSVKSEDTINGIYVVEGPNYPQAPESGMRTEYLNKRTVECIFGWEIADPESEVVAFEESIIEENIGSADFVVQEALSGTPQQQFVTSASKQVYIQRGFAIGYSDYIAFPSLAYPVLYLLTKKSHRILQSPKMLGRYSNHMFRSEWHYHFEAPAGLSLGNPSVPTIDS